MVVRGLHCGVFSLFVLATSLEARNQASCPELVVSLKSSVGIEFVPAGGLGHYSLGPLSAESIQDFWTRYSREERWVFLQELNGMLGATSFSFSRGSVRRDEELSRGASELMLQTAEEIMLPLAEMGEALSLPFTKEVLRFLTRLHQVDYVSVLDEPTQHVFAIFVEDVFRSGLRDSESEFLELQRGAAEAEGSRSSWSNRPKPGANSHYRELSDVALRVLLEREAGERLPEMLVTGLADSRRPWSWLMVAARFARDDVSELYRIQLKRLFKEQTESQPLRQQTRSIEYALIDAVSFELLEVLFERYERGDLAERKTILQIWKSVAREAYHSGELTPQILDFVLDRLIKSEDPEMRKKLLIVIHELVASSGVQVEQVSSLTNYLLETLLEPEYRSLALKILRRLGRESNGPVIQRLRELSRQHPMTRLEENEREGRRLVRWSLNLLNLGVSVVSLPLMPFWSAPPPVEVHLIQLLENARDREISSEFAEVLGEVSRDHPDPQVRREANRLKRNL